MISEIVVLLALIGFLCIRNEYVERRGALLLAIVLWGVTRVLMELNIRVESSTGEFQYQWASLVACVAAASLAGCLLCICWACWRGGRGARGPARDGAEEEDSRDEMASPSERLKRLVNRDGQG